MQSCEKNLHSCSNINKGSSWVVLANVLDVVTRKTRNTFTKLFYRHYVLQRHIVYISVCSAYNHTFLERSGQLRRSNSPTALTAVEWKRHARVYNPIQSIRALSAADVTLLRNAQQQQHQQLLTKTTAPAVSAHLDGVARARRVYCSNWHR